MGDLGDHTRADDVKATCVDLPAMRIYTWSAYSIHACLYEQCSCSCPLSIVYSKVWGLAVREVRGGLVSF